MKTTLVDTDILSMYFRGDKVVESNFDRHMNEFGDINISIVTYYEIVSGLKHKDAKKQLASFIEFVDYNTVLPITELSCTVSAELYATLRKKGTPIDDIDLLIAGIAISNDLVLATNNEKHFKNIKTLKIVNWSARKY